MKIEISGKPKTTEKTIRLQLREGLSGAIMLCAVDGNGIRIPGGNLVSVLTNGTLFLHESISPHCGLELDTRGCVKHN